MAVSRKKNVILNANGSPKNSVWLNLLLLPFSVIVHTLRIIYGVLYFLYVWLIKIPDFKSHTLGIVRLIFWGTLFFAMVNDDPASFPFVAWGPSVDYFMSFHPFLSIVTDIFALINLLVQVFVATGFAYENTSYTRNLLSNSNIRLTGVNQNSNYPAIEEGMGFLDKILDQQSSRGKVEYMRNFFGGHK